MRKNDFEREMVERMKDIYADNNIRGTVYKKDIPVFMQALNDLIIENLTDNIDEKINLGEIGSFKGRIRPPKDGVSNLTGDKWHLDERKEIYFKINDSIKYV